MNAMDNNPALPGDNIDIKGESEICWCMDHAGDQLSWDDALERIREFHGHTAPGLVVGVKMVSLAMRHAPPDTLFDVVCETESCLPDAVQMLTPCTIGNGWLKILDLGRYALSLYDKYTGDGVRVFLDPEKLAMWPEFHGWFYKKKPKKEQDFERLIQEIRRAGDAVLTHHPVRVRLSRVEKTSKGAIGTCPVCQEAYPVKHGGICRGCSGGTPYESKNPSAKSPQVPGAGPTLYPETIPVEQAVGTPLLHDMTRVIPGVEKTAAFRKGHLIRAGDICRLKKMGRRQIFAESGGGHPQGARHEDDAVLAFAGRLAGDGVGFDSVPREGKIRFTARRDGLLQVNRKRLLSFNRIEGVMCATLRSFSVVGKSVEIAATRAIPLYLRERFFQMAMAVLAEGPVLEVLPIRRAAVGILVTGNEIFDGLIEDAFIPLVRAKVEAYQCTLIGTVITPDERESIASGVGRLLDSGADLIITTAGLSVDPDDVTRQGLLDAGCQNLFYSMPVLPGAMSLVAEAHGARLLGIPACGLFYEITAFDLLLPRILAGVEITREDLAGLGHGGLCRHCKQCTFHACSFGK